MRSRGAHHIGRCVLALILAAAYMLAVPLSTDAATPYLWTTSGPTNVRLTGVDITPDGTTAYAVNDLGREGNVPNLDVGRVWQTLDRGATWALVATSPMGAWLDVAITADASTVMIVGQLNSGTGANPVLRNAVYVSTDSAVTWADVTPDPNATYTDVDMVADGSVIAVASSNGVLVSGDDGQTWTTHGAFTGSPKAIAIGEDATSVVIHAAYTGSVETALLGDTSATSVEFEGVLYDLAASSDGSAIIAGSQSPAATHLSIDRGATWTTTPQPEFAANQTVSVGVSGDGTTFTATAYSSPLIRSALVNASVSGMTWSVFHETLSWLGLAMSSDGSVVIGVTENGRIRTSSPTPPPVLGYAMPVNAPAGGGTTVWMGGQYLFDVQSITVGGRPATSINSSTDGRSVEAVLPAGNPLGPADIVITTAYGTATLAAGITFYQPGPPRITAITASGGSYRGGQTVTVSGSGLLDLDSVHIGDNEVDWYYAPNDNTLLFGTPPNRIGLLDIRLEGARGSLLVRDGWNSQWVTTSGAPRWYPLDPATEDTTWLDSVNALAQAPDGSIYVGGQFDDVAEMPRADFIARWNGVSWSALGSDGAGGPALSSGGAQGAFGDRGVLDIAIDDAGRVWAGGVFSTEFGGGVQDANIARWDPSTDTWTVPGQLPDGVVEAVEWVPGVGLYVGGEFRDIAGIDAADAVALLDDGVWSALGSNGSGGGVIASEGAMSPYWIRSLPRVLTLASTAQQQVMVGGSFMVPNLTLYDALLRWDPVQAEWYPGLASPVPMPIVFTDIEVVEVAGSEAILAGMCLMDPFGTSYGYLLYLDSSMTSPIGAFDDCIRDIAIVAGHPVVGGWFGQAQAPGDVDFHHAAGAAIFTAEGWVDLGVDARVNSLLALDDGRLLVGGVAYDRIGGTAGATGLGISSSLLPLVGQAASVSATSASPAAPNTTAGQTITITGSGFTRDTEVTYGGRPAPNVQYVSATELRFTTRAVPAGPTPITVYGDIDTSTVTVSAVALPPPPPPPTGGGSASGGGTAGGGDSAGGTTTAPAEDGDESGPSTTAPDDDASPADPPRAPTVDQIARFPIGTLVPAGSRLLAGTPVVVTGAGFVPGEQVVVAIASTPRVIGTGSADDTGRVSVSAPLPLDLTGAHTLVIWSPTTGRGIRQPIVVTAATLPATGGGLTVWPAAVMVLFGLLVVLTTRRRPPPPSRSLVAHSVHQRRPRTGGQR